MEECKDCLRCKFEPDWKWESPFSQTEIGVCKNEKGFFQGAPVLRFVRNESSQKFLTDCPAWAAKGE